MRDNRCVYRCRREMHPLLEWGVVHPAVKERVVLDRGDCESVAWLRNRHVEALIKLEGISALPAEPLIMSS